jgi:DNA-binding GntR family transcriptional regulator
MDLPMPIVKEKPKQSAPAPIAPAKAPISRRKKRMMIHDTLRSWIVTGKFPPGTQLLQNQLAVELGTSVNSVREALFELRYAGFVEKQEGNGFAVRELACEDFVEAREIYSLHQGFAARLCCRNANRKDLDGLRMLAQRILHHANSGRVEDLQEIALLDREFHDRILCLAGSRALARARETYFVPMLDVELTSEKCKRRFRESYDEHLAIVEAIEENRPDDAERLMWQHYENNYQCFRDEEASLGTPTVKWHGRAASVGGTPIVVVSFQKGSS